jgi:quercetin dioxygenase-like cupin family protein
VSKAQKINETYQRPGAHPRLKSVNFGVIEAVGPDVRMSINVVDEDSGTKQTSIHYIRTPAGSGSPKGMHSHPWEQTFYLLAGAMTVEIEGEPEPFEMEPGDVVVFPAGVMHRNYNLGAVETIHLSINTPHTKAAGPE